MDIEKLKALKTAIEIGSITQAAEHMGYSQPGLTGMLKRLEQEIGYPLLRRGTKGVRLTEAGEAVMPYIERILRESDTFEHAVRALRPAQQDELRIGSYTSISKNWLPQVIRGFSRKYPGVRPCISTIATQDSAVIKMGEQGLGGQHPQRAGAARRDGSCDPRAHRSARLSRDRRGRRARQKAQPRHPRVSDMPAGGCAAKRTKSCLTYTPYLSFIINLPFLLGKICFIMQA